MTDGSREWPSPADWNPGERAVLDVSVLRELVGDAPETVREFLTDFRTMASAQAVELRLAIEACDPARVGDIAHRLKSASLSIGALTAGELCAAMELACRTQDKDKAAELVVRFDRELQAVDREISRLLAR